MKNKTTPCGMVFKSGVVFVMSCSKGGVTKSCPSRDSARIAKNYFLTVQR